MVALTLRGEPEPLPLPIDQSLFFKLVRVVNLTARPFEETLSHAHELGIHEWRTMVVLASRPGITARKVADITGLDKATINRALGALQAQARVRQQTDPQDARRTQFWLTAVGESLYRSLGVLAAEREQRLFASLGAADRSFLDRMLDQLIESLQQADPPPPADA